MSSSECLASRRAVVRGKAAATSYMVGVSPASSKGLGLEYMDFKEYEPWDDVKHVDWRLSARSIDPSGDYKLMVKVYRAERKVRVTFVADLSSSMRFGDKLATQSYVVSLLSTIAAHLEDEVYLVLMRDYKCEVFSKVTPVMLPYILTSRICKGKAEGRGDLGKAARVASRLGRCAVMLSTDYAHNPNDYGAFIDTVRAAGGEVAVYLVYDKWEVKKPVEAAVTLIGLEDGVSVYGDLEEIYELINEHIKEVRTRLRVKRATFMELGGLRYAGEISWPIISCFLKVREKVY